MRIERMTDKHISDVLKLADSFYNSPAVIHKIPQENIDKTINEAVRANGMIDGYVFIEDESIAGFSFVPSYFESEVGGMCVLIMDIFVDEAYRRRGYATQFLQFVFNHYRHAKRFRLEVAADNAVAISVYKKLGFEELGYKQMIIDN